ncbi:PLDc N-terminal domain-containing protein [Methanococcoides sp. FTZ1]|uniref:PLDc N-terminal domain-containing protein n=1 Tax=Methanococcoides sp. FTZ1 TaxID=3439061 RepID=UPI003F86A2FA
MIDSWIFFQINAILFLTFGVLAIAGTLFWLWMLVNCAMNEPSQGNDKLIWVIIIIFAQLIGALIYFFIRITKRIAQKVAMD